MKKVLWQEMRRTEIEAAVKARAIVIIPVGSTEQHANHLPVNTDANICFEIAKRAAQAIDEFPVLVLPVIWQGYSPHHMIHHGTITLKYHTLVDMLTQIASSVYAHGFRKILFLNGHVSNDAAITAMVRKLETEDGISTVLGFGYYQLPEVLQAMQAVCETDKGCLGHAGEIETSLQLYLQPELVDSSQLCWEQGGWGDPSRANRQKGERVFDAAVTGLISRLYDFHSGAIEERMVWRREIPDQ